MSTVVNAAYKTGGNGGRNLVRLSDGTLFAAFISNSDIFLYKSINDGASWTLADRFQTAYTMQDIAITTDGNKIFLINAFQNNFIYAFIYDKNGTRTNSQITIDSGQSAVSGCALAFDPSTGHLHAAWSSKNNTYPNSINIRYAKSINGGTAWSAVTQVSKHNYNGENVQEPSITIINGVPTIVARYNATNSQAITAYYWDGSGFSQSFLVNNVSYAHCNPSTVTDKNGVIHAVWWGKIAVSSTDSIIYSKSDNNGRAWTPPIDISGYGYNFTMPSITTDKTGDVHVMWSTVSTDKVQCKTLRSSVWGEVKDVTIGKKPSTVYDATFTMKFGDIPPVVYETTANVQFLGSYTTNNPPTVALVSPTNNQTLYENDVFNITGTALDADNGNTGTIRYQINTLTARAIKAFLSDGSTLESFSKSLTFKNGNLYDGTTLIAENLSDGVAHTLKVWATDDQGSSSIIREIPFYVVPNRAPLLTVNSPVIDGLINSDKFTVNGAFEDSDGNTTVVSYRINGATSVQIAEGVSGPFTFEVSFGQLNVGLNQIVVEAIDSYGAKVSKTIKLNKNEVHSEQLRSTARYKINPPTGSAKAVLLWIQRDENLDIDVSINMTMQGEAESFIPLTVSSSAPLEYGSSTIEDEFYYEANGSKDNIILQIDMERTSLEVYDKIYLISGVLD